MAIKGVSVDLEQDLHAKVSGVAKLRGQKIPQAYTEALERWLDWATGKERLPSPLGELTAEEENVLAAVLEFMRDESVSRTNPITFKPSLIELGKRYAKRRASST